MICLDITPRMASQWDFREVWFYLMMIYAFFFRPLQAISRAFEYMRTELAAVRITSWYQLGRKIDYEQWYPFSFAHLTELNHLHRRARLRLTVPRALERSFCWQLLMMPSLWSWYSGCLWVKRFCKHRHSGANAGWRRRGIRLWALTRCIWNIFRRSQHRPAQGKQLHGPREWGTRTAVASRSSRGCTDEETFLGI